jgi:hypothetical protein
LVLSESLLEFEVSLHMKTRSTIAKVDHCIHQILGPPRTFWVDQSMARLINPRLIAAYQNSAVGDHMICGLRFEESSSPHSVDLQNFSSAHWSQNHVCTDECISCKPCLIIAQVTDQISIGMIIISCTDDETIRRPRMRLFV